ncbi:MAG: indolepyruvate ferredoxin oxidoreductase family protein [Burkholderiales bacterium]|nr:indolepyruvate ferredoxin oxidoreductase family protein [Burkholderiales bacterium]
MNAPVDPKLLESVSLEDKYTHDSGTAFMTGTQALVRLPMLQRKRDLAAGKNTAGFISGYRGSPLGGYDQALAKAKKHLQEHHLVFQPGVNEDLAATSIWGTQQVNLFQGARYDGVFGIWYGKGPGVDRCGDVFKHANMAGTSPWGGVLALAGDDHGAKSSTTAHQSEQIFIAVSTPVFYPASVQDILDYGIHGFAMSRYASLWSGVKCVTDIVESGATVDLSPARVAPVLPADFALPPDGLSIRFNFIDFLGEEARLLNYKLPAVKAYVRANRLNRVLWREKPGVKPTLGLASAGKAYADLRQALADLGIDETAAGELGLRLFKIAVTWPLEESGAREFAQGLSEILAVEEKRPLIESQLKEILYGMPGAPRVTGKQDDTGAPLLPLNGELTPSMIARAVVRRLLPLAGSDLRARLEARIAFLDAREGAVAKALPVAVRTPYFCSGCPHNTSTRVPEGSRALAGIGCHYMAQWMDRETATFTHMGAEGVTWAGAAHFTDEKHVFVNLGDGTYFHSGLLAIRAAVASKVNATYKILFNDAVAMTGGQRHDGPLNPWLISQQLHAEGVKPIMVVTDEPAKYGPGTPWAPDTTVHHRDELDAVQKRLREMPGISAVIYDQTCASEKRRRRKIGQFPDPARRAFINDAVCEGCGDCSVKSNCISVEPLETEFGRKRRINQSSCNKDYSCVNGFCPSFVTVEGGGLRKPAAPKLAASAKAGADATAMPAFPAPAVPDVARPFNILVTGIGGTGVITIGQIVAVAAHIEGKSAQVLDMSGLAQKGGQVTSHVQIAAAADDLHATRVGTAAADLVVGADLVVTAGKDVLSRVGAGRTRVLVNSTLSPTAAFVKDPNWKPPVDALEHALVEAAGRDAVSLVPANRLATALMGDAIATNMFMLGYAFQNGAIPVGEAALMRAIELNGVAVDFNKRAFDWGRYAAVDAAAVERIATPAQVVSIAALKPAAGFARNLEEIVARRVEFLTAYQDAAYAKRYADFVETVRQAEAAKVGGTRLAEAVARYCFKLMAYKDEYEVARLYADPAFMEKVRGQFDGDYKLRFHLAPPLLARRNDKGELVKKAYGPWVFKAFGLLAKLKGLRGTAFDIFGRTEERRTERALIGAYQATVSGLLGGLSKENIDTAVAIASIPEEIRGYGHVKERHLKAAQAKEAALLEAWRNPGRAARAA